MKILYVSRSAKDSFAESGVIGTDDDLMDKPSTFLPEQLRSPTQPKKKRLIATEYKTRLKHKEKCGEGAMAFYFEKPPGFEFEAGQYIDLTLINPTETDPDGNIRSFSLASAPADEHLLIVTRIRDTAFKRSLQQLPIHSEVEMDGPFAV